MLLLGIDDAGRGPVIGPMILAGVLITKIQEKSMRKCNIKDSKAIHNSHHEKLVKIIEKNSLTSHVVKSFPEEIDNSENLNTLEALKTAEIINKINTSVYKKEKIIVFIDCPSTNAFAWRSVLLSFIAYSKNLELHVEHKADANHLVVGAASLIAKYNREKEVAKIKKQYGEIGSGYPHDPITQKFLKEKGKKYANTGIFRKSWSTWKRLYREKGQSKLGSF